jgi:hypothetical protein
MSHNKADIVLCVSCPDDKTREWILNSPQGRDTFRIVVRCRREEIATSPKAHLWSHYFSALVRAALTAFALLRIGHS